ncbi:hypothetical protein [Chryseobacterium sp. R2A-55]|uniref:hypothetical protein n=1 Tax=Chryseobacterium sp. R2A-55 TaxID=2744445 RepID=UPI001F3DE8E0|nr:hypothetical protein [Chryseobacterium sp. R2A-55]
MKHLSYFLSYLIFLIFYNVNAQNFDENKHDIVINTNNVFRPASKIEMLSSLKFNNEYYSIFEEKQMYDFRQTRRYLIKFDKTGKILMAEKFPVNFANGNYLDFFVQDDKLFMQDQINFRYNFDLKTNKFSETTKGNDLVFEDDNYKVMYKSFGEWGEATWFINKKDKSEFCTSLDGQNVNFVNGKFYITNISSIWEIENPKNLNKCEANQYYDVIIKKQFGMFESYNYDKGISRIFKDSVEYNPYDFQRSIDSLNYAFLASYVTNGDLYQITQLKNNTAITKIIKNKVEILYQFDEKFNFFSWYNEYRGTNNNQKFFKFKNGYNSFGFFEVEDQKIDITKVKFEYDSLQYIKSDNIVNLISRLTHKKQISKKEIIEFEQSTKGTDIQQYRTNTNHNGYYPRKFAKINIETMDFVKSENEFLTQDIEYLFTENDKELKAIYCNYDKTKYFNSTGKNFFPIQSENSDKSDKIFKEKHSEIRNLLERVGNKVHVKPRPNKGTYESWIVNGWRFNLYTIKEKDINGVTLFICKEEDINENE